MKFLCPSVLSAIVVIQLISATDGAAQPDENVPAHTQLFVTADECLACHNSLMTPSGEDVSIGTTWRASIMAHSARDPYWQAAVRRETMDHPESQAAIEAECAKCHMPMASFSSHVKGQPFEIFSNLFAKKNEDEIARLAADGVSCSICHQIEDDNFGEEESFTGGFSVDTAREPGERRIFGPFEISAGLQSLMRSASTFLPA